MLAPLAHYAGLAASLIDARVDSSWVERISALSPTDLLAVSVMTGHAIRDAVKASEIAHVKGAKVVWGGPHVTLFPSETLVQAPVDAVIPGFGYVPFACLLREAASNQWPEKSDSGVLVRVNSGYTPHLCSSRLSPPSADLLPPPYLDLVSNWETYLNPDIAIATRTVSIITSEGCTRKCTFCSEPRTSGSNWLARDINQVVVTARELCERSGANGIKIHDPNFFHDMRRALRFSHIFSKEIGIPWAASIHPADLAITPDQILQQLNREGLVRLLVGLESPDPKIIRLAGKQYDPAIIPELAKKLARNRIRGMFTFIVGWPDTTPEHYELTIKCAFDICSIWEEHQAKIHFLEPWPGTPIFNLLVRRGFRFPKNIAEWADIDYYQAQFAMIHDLAWIDAVRDANRKLSPYVNA